MMKHTTSRVSLLVLVLVLVFSTALFASGSQEESGKVRMAAIFPGSIQDADYNTLGYVALQEAGNANNVEVAYSEKVAVPDAERVLREYANAGYKIIWVHGNQFNGAAFKVGPDFPDVSFIVEVDANPDQQMPNFWYMDRNYYTGFYVIGSLASMKTQSGIVGYVGGLELPFLRGAINAIRQAFNDLDSSAKLEYVFVGDFNDPVKTRQAAEGLISQGADVIISAVNLGNFGLYTAAKEAKRPVFLTTTYTDKYDQAPEHYMTSELFNFQIPLTDIVGQILDGTKGGSRLLEYGPGKPRYTQFPIRNVSDEINAKVEQISLDVADGKIKVAKNLDKILPR